MMEKRIAEPIRASNRRVERRRVVRASIYLLPNMITAGSLFFGFFAIRMASEGNFVLAAYGILAAGVCDGLDGSVARLTRTQSGFGVQFDSLCDLVAFGVAPAWLAYQFAAQDAGRLGFAAAFIYLACGALRLARFNVASSVGRASGNFSGIPIPIAAAGVAVYVLLENDLTQWLIDDSLPDFGVMTATFLLSAGVRKITVSVLLFVLALGMISTFEYFSTKKIRLPRKKPFRVFAGILVGTIVLVSLDLTITLSVLLLTYYLHGPLMALIYKRDRSEEEDVIFRAGVVEDEGEGEVEIEAGLLHHGEESHSEPDDAREGEGIK